MNEPTVSFSIIGNGGPLCARAESLNASRSAAASRGPRQILPPGFRRFSMLLTHHECGAHFHGLKYQPYRREADEQPGHRPRNECPHGMLRAIVLRQAVSH